MLSREEFKDMWRNIPIDVDSPDSPLWQPEQIDELIRCEWFVLIQRSNNLLEFHNWNLQHLRGPVRCFSAGRGGEWWGFAYKEDVVLFILKWT